MSQRGNRSGRDPDREHWRNAVHDSYVRREPPLSAAPDGERARFQCTNCKAHWKCVRELQQPVCRHCGQRAVREVV